MAFKGFLEKFPDSALLIVGGGGLESTLKEMVKSFGIEEKVFFLGVRNDIPKILKTLDLFVFPTYREGLPLSLLEAMASEIPVIGSNIGCIREVFEDSDMGILIDPNSIDSIENAMEHMANLPEEARRLLGANARMRALNNFTAEKMAHEYQNIFEKVYREGC
jgi:glycosyltransferase involved in cell wall biosynthesis